MRGAKLTSFFVLFSLTIFGQNPPGTELRIKRAVDKITLDGVLDEESWQQADRAEDFQLNYPSDTTQANFQTVYRTTFDDEFFYVSFIAYDDSTDDVISSLRRDFNYDQNDNTGFVISPFNDKQNGFFFILTPENVQMEGIMSAGGTSDNSWNVFWDNKWFSEVKRYKDKWIGEIALPFKSFRYRSDVKEWNIAFDRFDLKRNQKSAWINTPINFPTASMAFSGQLVWEDPIPTSKRNISLIPYVAGNIATANSGVEPLGGSALVGFDAKAAITPSLTFDLTVNPDFSQAEVDQQVINLTRFEFQFPERRQFFLENSDLFSNAGFPGARPFFSRRIGLVQDSTGLFQRVPISFGARVSGSLNEKWRLSVMNMQTKEVLEQGLPAQNYGVATVMRNFGKQSNASVTFVNKQSLGVTEEDEDKFFHPSIFRKMRGDNSQPIAPKLFNRTLTADLELLSEDNKWYFSSYGSRSFDEGIDEKNMTGGGFFRYQTRAWEVSASGTYLGENYNAEAGFVPALGVYPGQIRYSIGSEYRIFPKNSQIVVMGPEVSYEEIYVPNQFLSDRNLTLGYGVRFQNTASMGIEFNNIYQKLTTDFTLADPDLFRSFLTGEQYNWSNVAFGFQSNSIKKINYFIEANYGGFYNGSNFNLNGRLNARYQPYFNISMQFDYNDLKLPENYGGDEKLFLVGPRVDLTFTDKLFLTTFVQYNNLLNNVNLNSRFQWRYAPASDFFLVYTENYFSDSFSSKNRALVFKLTYWLNL